MRIKRVKTKGENPVWSTRKKINGRYECFSKAVMTSVMTKEKDEYLFEMSASRYFRAIQKASEYMENMQGEGGEPYDKVLVQSLIRVYEREEGV